MGSPLPRRQTFVGSDDMNVGFKIALADQDGCLPQMGIVGDMFVPTGSSAFTAGEVLPEIEWIYTWSLTKKLSVTGVTFLTDTVDDVTNHTYLEFSEGVEADLALSDTVGSYIDWHVSSPDGADTNSASRSLRGRLHAAREQQSRLGRRGGRGAQRCDAGLLRRQWRFFPPLRI